MILKFRIYVFRNPNNNADQFLQRMVWPKYSIETEFYLDIGTHLVEKKGMFLQRYGVWDNTIAEFANEMNLMTTNDAADSN